MTREELKGIRERFNEYRNWPDTKRQSYFYEWLDKRDLRDLIDGLERTLDSEGVSSEAEATMRVLAEAMAEQAMDRALGLEVGKRNALVRENTALKQRVAELEAQVKFPAMRPDTGEGSEKLRSLIRLENEREYVKRLRVEAQGVCMCVTVDIRGADTDLERLRANCLSCCAKAELLRRGLSGL